MSEQEMYELTEDFEAERDRIARTFYRLEGWEEYWPYEQRPRWLRVRYP